MLIVCQYPVLFLRDWFLFLKKAGFKYDSL